MAREFSTRIWIGTRKGAFAFTSKDRKKWDCDGPFFAGQEVHHVAQDPRDPKRHYAAVGNAWFGPHLHASTDNGKTWQISEKGLEVKGITGKSWQVTEKGMELKATPDATLKRIWHIAPGAVDEPGAVYLGADPGVLFRSCDNGANWEMVAGLCNHPTREKWNPGAGGMMVHSIQCLGKGRLIVGISAAGAFRSNDNGKTWTPFNGNVLVEFGPEKFPEVGQCVHKLKAHPRNPEALYQQNHCGVYRAGFADETWADISKGLPSRFGFGLAVPAAEKDTLFTIPIVSAEERYVPKGKLRVALQSQWWQDLEISHVRDCLSPMPTTSSFARRCPPMTATLPGSTSALQVEHCFTREMRAIPGIFSQDISHRFIQLRLPCTEAFRLSAMA